MPSRTPANVDGPCPPLTLLVNGTPMIAKTNRAYGFVESARAGAYVIKSSSVEIPCDEILSGKHTMKPGEVSIDVGSGPAGSAQQFVFFDNASTSPRTHLVKTPAKRGDTVEVCVRERVRLTSSSPIHDTPMTVEIEGLVRGSYCGTLRR